MREEGGEGGEAEEAGGEGDQVLDWEVDVGRFGAVDCEARDEGAGVEVGGGLRGGGFGVGGVVGGGGGSGSWSDDAADEAVARGQGGGVLERVDPQPHVDVGVGEAGVEHLDLEVVLWGVGEDVVDHADFGDVAEGADERFADGGGHFEGVGGWKWD